MSFLEQQKYTAMRCELSLNTHFTPVDLSSRLSAVEFEEANSSSAPTLVEALSPKTPEEAAALGDSNRELFQKMSQRFQENLRILEFYYPEIYEKFLHYKPREGFDFFCTANGIANIAFSQRNGFFYPDADPKSFCARQVEFMLQQNPLKVLGYTYEKDILGQIHHRYHNELIAAQEKEAPVIEDTLDLTNVLSFPTALIFGIGLGYHITELLHRRQICNIVLIEPNPDIFYASLYTFDWAAFIEDCEQEQRSLLLIIDDDPFRSFLALDNFYERHGRMLSGFFWMMQHYASPQMTALINRFLANYPISYSSLGFFDDHLFGLSHGLHALEQKAHFVRKDIELPQNWRHVPCCLVANGPSLSKDLPFLRAIQDKVIIFACGSALETLFNAGIQATFYGATERLRIVGENLDLIPDTEYVSNTVLVSTDVVHPDTLRRFKHTALFGKSEETLYYYLEHADKATWERINPLPLSNPLVGNLGLSAAVEFGFKEIYLFGFDNGSKDKTVLHPEENVFYKEICTEQHPDDLNVELEGNFGGKIYSNDLYKLSARYMSELITRTPQISFYNCSDGAALHGAKPTHAQEELSQRFLCLPDIERDELIKIIEEKKTFTLPVPDVEALLNKQYFNHITKDIESQIQTLRAMRPLRRFDLVRFIEEICENIERYREEADGQYAFLINLIDGSIYNYFICILHELYSFIDEQHAIMVALSHCKYIEYFLDDTRKLYTLMPKYYAEDHHSLLNGKIGFDHEDSPAPELIPRQPYVKKEDQARLPKKFVKRLC